MRSVFILSFLTAIALAVSACSGSSDNGGAPPCVTPTELPAPQLLYPIPGATGVPDNAFVVELAGIGVAGGVVTLSGPGAPLQTNPEGAPSPLPSPAATPQAGASPSFFGIPTLASKTSYNVVFTASLPGECTPGQQSGTLGSFTTQ